VTNPQHLAADKAATALIRELVIMEHRRVGDPLRLQVRPYSAFILVTGLQLGIQSPRMHPDMGAELREIARGVQLQFHPDYRAMIENGWHL
jgi:hypothetical protein